MFSELRKFRKLIKELSKKLQHFDRRVRSDEIFQVCHEVEPSSIGIHQFLLFYISYSMYSISCQQIYTFSSDWGHFV
jgi:hypothetical protein